MKLTLPFLSTRFEEDLLLTLLATPVWWILGFNFFIYQAVVFLCFSKLLIAKIREGEPLAVPKPALWLGLFLVTYAASLLINAPSQPAQRVMASVNNYILFLMGFVLILVIYHAKPGRFFRGLLDSCAALTWITGLIAIFFLKLWFSGRRGLEVPSLSATLLPSLASYPFFNMLVILRTNAVDWFVEDVPRLCIYSSVVTATGGFMLMILPFAMARSGFRRRAPGFGDVLMFLLGFISLGASFSRTALCAFVGAFGLVWVIERRARWWILLGAGVLFFLGSDMIFRGISWIFKARSASTVGRFNLYYDAVSIAAEENLLLGIGVRLREGFTMMSIGSHATYVGLLLMSGLIGLSFFILFQLSVFKTWLALRGCLKTRAQGVLWRAAGVSFLGINGWILTENVDGLPFICFAYFLSTGVILLLARIFESKRFIPEEPQLFGSLPAPLV